MEIVMNNELKLAQVWCSRADQRDKAKQQKIKEFRENENSRFLL